MSPSSPRSKSKRSTIERLEDRRLFSVAAMYYPADGTGNNTLHPTWGSSNTDLLRKSGTAYGGVI